MVKIDVYDLTSQMKRNWNTISRRRCSLRLELVVKVHTVHKIPFLISSVCWNHTRRKRLTVCQWLLSSGPNSFVCSRLPFASNRRICNSQHQNPSTWPQSIPVSTVFLQLHWGEHPSTPRVLWHWVPYAWQHQSQSQSAISQAPIPKSAITLRTRAFTTNRDYMTLLP